jgi:hypothetical protein
MLMFLYPQKSITFAPPPMDYPPMLQQIPFPALVDPYTLGSETPSLESIQFCIYTSLPMSNKRGIVVTMDVIATIKPTGAPLTASMSLLDGKCCYGECHVPM